MIFLDTVYVYASVYGVSIYIADIHVYMCCRLNVCGEWVCSIHNWIISYEDQWRQFCLSKRLNRYRYLLLSIHYIIYLHVRELDYFTFQIVIEPLSPYILGYRY